MIKGIVRKIISRAKSDSVYLKFWKPKTVWLYQNRHLRMDANEPVNDIRRRDFHKDRYFFAADYIKANMKGGITVLDAACGTGYGSEILKKTAAQVFGVDISPQAIEYASRKYGGKECVFKTDDVTKLSVFSKEYFDAVVSFETIEHIEEPLVFLERIKSLLKPGGVLILSTPNLWGKTKDHKLDYDYRMLVDQVERFFRLEAIYVQNSGCLDLWINRNCTRRLVNADPENIKTAECFIAVCRKEG
jgi:2-polyprenyl-3-methyl-5-hydroxy-6-metoxy-1,4-benzoquinol methylase